MIIITIGLSILIRETALHIWGADARLCGTSVTAVNLGGVLYHRRYMGGRNQLDYGYSARHLFQFYSSQ
jgi:hypothetical protein